MEALRAFVAGEDIGGGIAFRMTYVQARARGVWKHVEDVELGDLLWRRIGMALGEGMSFGDGFPRIPGAESLLLIPMALPLGFDEMEWILAASTCHKGGNIAENASGNKTTEENPENPTSNRP